MNHQSKRRSKTPDTLSLPSQRNTVLRDFEALDEINRHDMQMLSHKLSEQIIRSLTQSQNISKISELCLNPKIFQMPFKIRQLGGFNNMMNLRELDLSNNEIEKIENLGSLKQLRVLQLNSNCIRKIENISVLKNLEVLELSQNLIDEIPSLISLNKYLTTLDVSNNLIQKRDYLLNLRPCAKLRFVFIAGNPFTGYGDCLGYIAAHLRQLVNIDGQAISNTANFSQKFYVNQLAAETKAYHVKKPPETIRNEQNCFENNQQQCQELGAEDGPLTAKKNHRMYQAGRDSSPLQETLLIEQRRERTYRTLSKKSPLSLKRRGGHYSGHPVVKGSIKSRQIPGSENDDPKNNSEEDNNRDSIPKFYNDTKPRVFAGPQMIYQPNTLCRKNHHSFNENTLFTISDSNIDLYSSNNHEKLDCIERQSTNRTRRQFLGGESDRSLKLESYNNTKNLEEQQARTCAKETKTKPDNYLAVVEKNSSLHADKNEHKAELLHEAEIEFKEEDSNLIEESPENALDTNTDIKALKNEWQKIAVTIGELTECLNECKRQIDGNSETYNATMKQIEQLKEESLTLMKQINTLLEDRINHLEKQGHETTTDNTRLTLLNERSELISRIKEFLCLMDSENEYHMNYFLLALKIRCEKAELEWQSFLQTKKHDDQMNLGMRQETEDEAVPFEDIINELNNNHKKLRKLASHVLQIQKNLFPNATKGNSVEKKAFSNLHRKFLELEEKESQRMSLFCDLKEKYTSVSQLLQTLQLNHHQGKKLRSQILYYENKSSCHVNRSIQESAQSPLKIQSHNQAAELMSFQPSPHKSHSQAKEVVGRRDISQDLLNISSRENSKIFQANSRNHKKASKSNLTSHEASTNQEVGLNNSLQSQSLKNQSRLSQTKNPEDSLRSRFIGEAASANITLQSIHPTVHNEYCSEQPKRVDFGSDSPESGPHDKTNNLRYLNSLKHEAYRQECSKDEPPLLAASYSTNFATTIQESKSLHLINQRTCKECKQKDHVNEALQEQINSMIDENNKLTSNMQGLYQTLDQLRESFEAALKQQAEKHEEQFLQKEQQKVSFLQTIEELLEHSCLNSQTISQIKFRLDNLYESTLKYRADANGLQRDMPMILKIQADVIETLVAQRVTLEAQYQSSLKLYKTSLSAEAPSQGEAQRTIQSCQEQKNFDEGTGDDDMRVPASNFQNDKISEAEPQIQNFTPRVSQSALISSRVQSPQGLIYSLQQKFKNDHLTNNNTQRSAPELNLESDRLIIDSHRELDLISPSMKNESEKAGGSERGLNDSPEKSATSITNISQASKLGGGCQKGQTSINKAKTLSQITAALPQSQLARVHQHTLYQTNSPLKNNPFIKNQAHHNQRIFTLYDHNICTNNEISLIERNKNDSKTLDLSQSRNSARSVYSRAASPTEKPPIFESAQRQASEINRKDSPELTYSSPQSLNKILFGNKSPDKENRIEASNVPAASFILAEVPQQKPRTNDNTVKLFSSGSAPLIFKRSDGLPAVVSNMKENIAQTVYQKNCNHSQANLLNIHRSLVEYRQNKQRKSGNKSSKASMENSRNAKSSRSLSNHKKRKNTDDSSTPNKLGKLLSQINQNSTRKLSGTNSYRALTSSRSLGNIPLQNTTERSQIAQANNSSTSRGERVPIDQNLIFRKNSSYAADRSREVSINLQSFLENRRRMFDTPDIANYSDKFDMFSPYHPLCIHSVHEYQSNSFNSSQIHTAKVSRLHSRRGTQQYQTQFNEDYYDSRNRSSFLSNSKTKSRILSSQYESQPRNSKSFCAV